jgi:hypothetical protein
MNALSFEQVSLGQDQTQVGFAHEELQSKVVRDSENDFQTGSSTLYGSIFCITLQVLVRYQFRRSVVHLSVCAGV